MNRILLFVCGAILLTLVDSGFSQGSAFLYQGQLAANGSPANGSYDFTFTLFQAGAPTAGTLTNSATAVSDGLFSVALDFGPAVFNGSDLWLQIGVRTNGGAGFTLLAPMQPILPSPYAIMAGAALVTMADSAKTYLRKKATGPQTASRVHTPGLHFRPGAAN